MAHTGSSASLVPQSKRICLFRAVSQAHSQGDHVDSHNSSSSHASRRLHHRQQHVGSNLRYNNVYSRLFDDTVPFDQVENDRANISWSYVYFPACYCYKDMLG